MPVVAVLTQSHENVCCSWLDRHSVHTHKHIKTVCYSAGTDALCADISMQLSLSLHYLLAVSDGHEIQLSALYSPYPVTGLKF